jgi:TetR/AcrR family transcriptional regulator, transcriptional repressor for nem operon
MRDTREHLISTATGLFLCKGYGAVGTSELCRAAGVNKGTLYHFFPAKSDLLAAAIDAYAQPLGAAFAAVATSALRPRDKLAALFAVPEHAVRQWQGQTGSVHGCLVGNIALELGAAYEPVRVAVQSSLSAWQRAIEPVVAELCREGELPELDPSRGAALMVAMIQGGLVVAKARNDPDSLKQVAAAAFGALMGLATSEVESRDEVGA